MAALVLADKSDDTLEVLEPNQDGDTIFIVTDYQSGDEISVCLTPEQVIILIDYLRGAPK